MGKVCSLSFLAKSDQFVDSPNIMAKLKEIFHAKHLPAVIFGTYHRPVSSESLQPVTPDTMRDSVRSVIGSVFKQGLSLRVVQERRKGSVRTGNILKPTKSLWARIDCLLVLFYSDHVYISIR